MHYPAISMTVIVDEKAGSYSAKSCQAHERFTEIPAVSEQDTEIEYVSSLVDAGDSKNVKLQGET
jgi:hypothetical protein